MTPNPHDALFKATFSQVEHAAGLLRLVLPPEIARHVDFSTLASCPGTFIDETLKERFTDLLFSAKLRGRTAFFYFLLEHMSTVKPLMGLTLLRYEVRIWDRWLKENPNARLIPAILPVVMHHSAEGWTAEVTFESLLDVDAELLETIAPYVPRFRFLLDDISAASDEALRSRAMSALGKLVLWCLRNARSPEEIVRGLGGWLGLVREVRQAPNGAGALMMVFRYILMVNERFGSEELVGLLLRTVGEEGKEEMASVAEQLIEQGRQQGEQNGLLRGQRKVLVCLLRARFGELSESVVEHVNRADMAKLDLWTERVLSAPTLADVLGIS
jgi:hypothetical protein